MSLGGRMHEHPPYRQCSVVGPVVCLGSGVQRHDYVLHRRRLVLEPQLPPLSFDDRSLFGGRILLILRVPLERRHAGLGPQQRCDVEKLWPEGFLLNTEVSLVVLDLDVQDRGELHHLVLVRTLILGHIPHHTPSQVVCMPSCLDDSHAPAGHQTCPSTVCEPLVGLLEHREVPVQHVLLRMGVVNEQQVSTSTSDGRANTTREVLTPRRRVPPTCRLTVRG